jgi:hypothetical protein
MKTKKTARKKKGKEPVRCAGLFGPLDGTPHEGITANMVAEAIGETWNSIRPRFTSLSNPNPKTGDPAKIYDTNIRRPNASGRMATVWRAV